MKQIQSSKNQKSLKSIDSNQIKDKLDQNSKEERPLEIIDTNDIVTS
jgi:hypothetical protein